MSIKNWILIWVFLELSSFRFIIISKNGRTTERIIKYFLIQTIRSIFILLSISIKTSFIFQKRINWNINSSLLLLIRILIKGGLAPIHFWIPNVADGLRLKRLRIFLTIQKLAPTSIFILMVNLNFIFIIILICSVIGTFRQILTLNLKLLLTYSSISHSGWILIGRISKIEVYFLYLIIYTTIILQILIILYKKQIFSILFLSINKPLLILFLRLSGIPPLLGFFPKWISLINILSDDKMKLLSLFLILLTCLNIFIYVKIIRIRILKTIIKLNIKNKIEIKPLFSFYSNFFIIPLLITFRM